MSVSTPEDASFSDPLNTLGEKVRGFASRSHVPFSDKPRAAGLLLTSGRWVPGVRVESASFSLVIPALLNALTTAVACKAPPLQGVVLSHAVRPDEKALLDLLDTSLRQISDEAFVCTGENSLPKLKSVLNPYHTASEVEEPTSALAEARRLVAHAQVPLSRFPVGCLLETPAGLVPGVNVEYEDWTRTLCAERNALGTAVSYQSGKASALYLTSPQAPKSTPCGACRQLLLELAPNATVWMDQQDGGPDASLPTDLLPGGFTGQFLSDV